MLFEIFIIRMFTVYIRFLRFELFIGYYLYFLTVRVGECGFVFLVDCKNFEGEDYIRFFKSIKFSIVLGLWYV